MDFINMVYDEETGEVEGFEYVKDMELTPIQRRALESLTWKSE